LDLSKLIYKINLAPTQILAIGFLMLIALGTCLLALPVASQNGQSLSLVDAFFTATSAVCITGLVVVDTADYFSLFGQILIMLLIQVGGLGLMTFSVLVALMLGKKISLRERMLIKEAFHQTSFEGLVRLIKYVVLVTFILEGIGACFLAFYFVPKLGWVKGIYYSIFHAISAFCNAGFDLSGGFQSLAGYHTSSLTVLTLAGLIIAGGLGFPVLLELYKQKGCYRKLSLHAKVVLLVTAVLLVLGTVLIFALEYNNPQTLQPLPFHEKLLVAFFQGTTPRSAGFSILNINEMHAGSIFITIVLMFIGAAPSSMTGGIKITTVFILVMTVVSLARGREDTEVFYRRLPRENVYKALSIIIILAFVHFIAFILLTFTEQRDFLSLFFDVTSAVGTAGLSMGAMADFSVVGKLVIAVIMFIGRVGPLALALSLGARRRKTLVRYPEERILVG